jgi:predicted Zn-dependent protease
MSAALQRRWWHRPDVWLRGVWWLAAGTVGALGWPIAGSPCDEQGAEAIVRRVQEEWPVRASGDPIAAYVQGLGIRLARAAPSAPGQVPRRWWFHVIRDRSVYAFAVGDGHVFVTDGVILFARDESDLAAVLGHEMGHELAGHLCAGPPPTLWERLVDMFGGGLREKDGARHVAIGSLTQVIDPAKEREADRISLRLLSNAGFDPHAMLGVARRLPRADEAGHLADPQRVSALQQLLRRIPPVEAESSKGFLRVRAALSEQSAAPTRSRHTAPPPQAVPQRRPEADASP